MKKLKIAILSSLWASAVMQATAQEGPGLYSAVNEKTWAQLLESPAFQWRPPYTVNLLLNPVHSPDWIYLNPSMAVSRRRVTQNVSTTDAEKRKEANTQEDLVIQFAFDDPVFVPNFRLVNLKLEENRYPVATADYFANDIYYKIEYMAAALDETQTLLCMDVAVKNEGEHEREVHVRTKIAYYPENKIFDYHYIPYSWDAKKWMPYDSISMKGGDIYKGDRRIGRIASDKMAIEWEESKQCTDKQYEDILFPQVWYGSGYASPEFRLKDVQDVIHASGKLAPGDSTDFSLKVLVADDRITAAHAEEMDRLAPKEIKRLALNGFKQLFTDKTLAYRFPAKEWDDILAELQISTSQMLLKYPGLQSFQPAQGGSSERFYVWVFEAVQMLRPMLRTGRFEDVRKALDYIFSLQDAGVPPVGRFTTTAGAIGTTGPRWANTTGMALALACDYYLYSKDRAFIEQYETKILKALHWIAGEVKATRVLNPDGTRPPTYGIMPYAVASDGDEGFFVSATDLFSYWGFEKAVRLLEAIHHTEAAEMRKELDQYREDLLAAVGRLARPDGFIDRKLVVGNDKNNEAVKFANTDIMAPVATVGVLPPESDIFQKYIDYYERYVADGYFMGKMDRDIFYIIQCEHYWQPIYLMLGEWKKAFMALQACLKYGMSQDTHQTQERFDKRNPAFAPWQPNGSGNGGMIDMMLNALYFENGHGEATLLGCVPFEYLAENGTTSLKRLYTLTGAVDLEVAALDGERCRLALSSDNPLPARIRLPEHFEAQAETPSAKPLGGGVFAVEKGAKSVAFILSKND